MDRYAFDSFYHRDFNWYGMFCQSIGNRFFRHWQRYHWVQLLLLTVPLAMFPAIITCLLSSSYWGLPAFVFNLLILFYCLGSTHFDLLIDNVDEVELTDVKQRLFDFGNEEVTAVLFWFVLLGGSGAVLMRLLRVLSQYAENEKHYCYALQKQIFLVKATLTWLPARILSLAFILAGHFMKGFPVWLHAAWALPGDNKALLLSTGTAVISMELSGKTPQEQMKIISDLLDRSIIIILVVIALFTLSTWVS